MADLEKTKTIKYEGFRVVVGLATYGIGLARTMLSDKARQAEPEGANLDDPLALAAAVGRVVLWPSLIAAVIEHEGFDHWPITADELMALPEQFVTDWERAVYSLNPHWRPDQTPESAEKKVSNG